MYHSNKNQIISLRHAKTYSASQPSELHAGGSGDTVREDAHRYSLCALHLEYFLRM